MEDNEYTEFDYIHTPYVDRLLQEHHLEERRLVGIDATEEEKEELKDLQDSLNEDLANIREIQEDLVKYLRGQGCNCIDKYL
jgi:hypothetical protein